MSNTEMLVRLVIAAALGSLIGYERERLLWAAGISTHMLVCVGSCLIMIVSEDGFSSSDPADCRSGSLAYRRAGWLRHWIPRRRGILARGEIVKGLTTAASIWTVAAVGLAVGGGLYLAASASTVIILIISPASSRWRKPTARETSCMLKIEVDNRSLTPELLRSALDLRIGQVKRFLVESRNPEGTDDLAILLSRSPRRISQAIRRN